MPYFAEVKRFALFVAPARSGHSVVGHLLSAHPKVMISDELDALSYLREGYSASQIYALIKHQDWRLHQRKRQKSGYDYNVEGAWQGIYNKYPEVIGDAKGTRAIMIFGQHPDFVDELRSRVGVPLRIIFHLRNPYDIIATKIRRRSMSMGRAIEAIENQADLMMTAYSAFQPDERLIQYHEDLVSDPSDHFRRMFAFLDVDEDEEIVRGCANKIWGNASQSRHGARWTSDAIDRVERAIEGNELFSVYGGNPSTTVRAAGRGTFLRRLLNQ